MSESVINDNKDMKELFAKEDFPLSQCIESKD
jgi:hypothetical protein